MKNFHFYHHSKPIKIIKPARPKRRWRFLFALLMLFALAPAALSLPAFTSAALPLRALALDAAATGTESSSANTAGSENADGTTSNTPADSVPDATSGTVSDAPPGTATDSSDPPAFTLPDLIIKSVNPGAETPLGKDIGEVIELQNLSGQPLSLDGFSLRYVGSTVKKDDDGNPITSLFYTFPAGSIMTGDTITLTYKKAPYADFADLLYASTLALKADLYLFYDDTEIDHVCWRGGKTCIYEAFTNDSTDSLVRDLTTNTFERIVDYQVPFDATHSSLVLPATESDDSDSSDDTADESADDESPDDGSTLADLILPAHCFDLEFTELLSYYSTDQTEQFIELYNPSLGAVDLTGCALQYKNKTYPLDGIIAADSYFAFHPTFSLTKNPSTSNTLTLLDSDGTVIDELVYFHGQKKSTSFAKIYDTDGTATWRLTYAPTPSLANVYQEFQTCPAGKVINPATGNCINDTSASTTTTTCPEGKYLNPLTGRCKTLATTTTLAACAEGYERNPETNRCRKITTANDGADYALVPTTGTNSTTIFVAAGIVAVIVGIGIIYIILQFRYEIARTARKARQRLHDFRVNSVARVIGRHRNKDT